MVSVFADAWKLHSRHGQEGEEDQSGRGNCCCSSSCRQPERTRCRRPQALVTPNAIEAALRAARAEPATFISELGTLQRSGDIHALRTICRTDLVPSLRPHGLQEVVVRLAQAQDHMTAFCALLALQSLLESDAQETLKVVRERDTVAVLVAHVGKRNADLPAHYIYAWLRAIMLLQDASGYGRGLGLFTDCEAVNLVINIWHLRGEELGTPPELPDLNVCC